MALIRCSDCKKAISDRAMACPNCGAPVVSESAQSRAVGLTGDKSKHGSNVMTRPNKFARIAGLTILGGFVVFVLVLSFKAAKSVEEAEKRYSSARRTDNSTSASAQVRSPSSEDKKPPLPATEVRSLQYTLAILENGGGTSEKSPLVERFGLLLQELDSKFVEDQKAIADMTVKSRELLEKDGISESISRIMEAVNGIFDRPFPNQKYAEYVAAYITLRSQGQSHEKAAIGLKALIQSMGVK